MMSQGLAERGVRPALIYDAEGFVDMAGGARRGATYLDNLNLQLTLDMRRLVGWPGATVFLYGLGIHGGQPSEFAGDAQGVSSIAAPRKWTLEEAWLEQNLFGNRVSLTSVTTYSRTPENLIPRSLSKTAFAKSLRA